MYNPKNMSENMQHNREITADATSQVIPDGVSREEAQKILDGLHSISDPLPEGLQKAKTALESLIYENIPLSQETQDNLETLMQDLEKKGGFNEAKEKFGEKNEVIKKLLDISDIYFTKKLTDLGYQENQTDTIKLVLWDKLLHGLDLQGGVKGVASQMSGKLQGLIDIFSPSADAKQETSIEKLMQGLDKITQDIGTHPDRETEKGQEVFTFFDSILAESFTKLKDNTQDYTSDKSLEDISLSLSGVKRTFQDIETSTDDAVKQIEPLQDMGKSVVAMLDKLPEEAKGGLGEFLQKIAKDYPMLGFILGLFFPGLLGESVESSREGQSIVNLVKYYEEPNSLIQSLDENTIKNLKPENLKSFFSFLDAKSIDYKKDTFWKELFTGESKDEKILTIHNLLKNGGTNFSISPDDTKDNSAGFIARLNNLAQIENKLILANNNQKMTQLQQEIGQAQAQTGPQTPSANNSSTKTETLRQEIQEKQAELERLQFEDSIRSITSLPAEILYRGEQISIDLKDNKKIVIGEHEYNISIQGAIEAFNSISFKNGQFVIHHKVSLFSSTDRPIEHEHLQEVLISLLETSHYSLDISDKNAKLKITKVT